MSEPQKFIKDDAGVRKINPEWKKWQEALKASTSSSSSSTATTIRTADTTGEAPTLTATPVIVSVAPPMRNAATALPVVSSLAEQQKFLGGGTTAAPSFEAAVQRTVSEANAQVIGLNPEQMMGALNFVFARYEIPMGLLSKLEGLARYQIMEMIVDDSGSMGCSTDSKDANGKVMTRWSEVLQRLQQMFEVMAVLPAVPPCYIRFLNRSNVLEFRRNQGEKPDAYLHRVNQALRDVFAKPPSGSTPARERIAESLARYPGAPVLRYFFGDGVPDGGEEAQKTITKMLVERKNPAENPFTFLSCTDEDSAVEWMKEAEESAPYCAEFDDFADESEEVLKDQGKAFPYTFGMHLVGQLVAAFNPNDLDAMDESVPFTKPTLDAIQGYVSSPAEFKYYFDSFLEAQRSRSADSKLDKIKKEYVSQWPKHFDAFVTAPAAKDIPIAQEYFKKVQSESSSCVIA